MEGEAIKRRQEEEHEIRPPSLRYSLLTARENLGRLACCLLQPMIAGTDLKVAMTG